MRVFTGDAGAKVRICLGFFFLPLRCVFQGRAMFNFYHLYSVVNALKAVLRHELRNGVKKVCESRNCEIMQTWSCTHAQVARPRIVHT